MSTIARFSVEEYDRMIAASVFDSTRMENMELIHGELRVMSPIGLEHQRVVNVLLNKWARKLPLPDNVWFQVQNPVGFATQQSVPQPDMTWIAERNYASRPGARDVFLLIEVSDSSLDYDRGEKAELYAAARIKDYWIVNLGDECVEVRRNARRGKYTSLEVFRPGEHVHPLAFPDLALPVRLLFDKVR